MTDVTDLTGRRFGRLLVIERANKNTVTGRARWIVDCDCGKTALIKDAQSLAQGNTNSCGCLQKEAFDDIRKRSRHYTITIHKDLVAARNTAKRFQGIVNRIEQKFAKLQKRADKADAQLAAMKLKRKPLSKPPNPLP